MPDVAAVYNKTARRYDITSRIPLLLGFRTDAYRRKSVVAARIRPGDTVVLIGCGTGTDIPRVRRVLGNSGRIIGVDLSRGMLDVAQSKARRRNWSNVEFWQGDAAQFPWPKTVNCIIANFTLKFQPKHPDVIAAGRDALASGGRFVITDFRVPRWAYPIAARLLREFGHDANTFDRYPPAALKQAFGTIHRDTYWLGGAYVAVAEKS